MREQNLWELCVCLCVKEGDHAALMKKPSKCIDRDYSYKHTIKHEPGWELRGGKDPEHFRLSLSIF